MANFLERMRDGLRRGPRGGKDSQDAESPKSGAASDPEAGDLDDRRLAERKADAAGRKWREAAEVRGEIAKESGGPQGLEPTRYGDWERAGRCVDF